MKSAPARRLWLIGTALVCILAFVPFVSERIGVQSVDLERLKTAQVSTATFIEKVFLLGIVGPQNTVYLDSVSGGRVVERMVEEGTLVDVGQPIIVLSYRQLELQLLHQEAKYTEQLSGFALAQNEYERLQYDYRRQLEDSLGTIQEIERELTQKLPFENTSISRNEISQLRAALDRERNTHDAISLAMQRHEENASESLRKLEQSLDRMAEGLSLMNDEIDHLTVRASLAGRVSVITPQVGEVISEGGRVAEVQSMDRFKLIASVDEYYLGRIVKGLDANFQIGGAVHTAPIARVRSTVTDQKFIVEFAVPSDVNSQLRSGQSVRLELALDSSNDATVLRTGDYLDVNGGQSVFVLDEQGQYAERRSIRLGRRNTDQVEVVAGLRLGERVIVDGYTQLGDVDRIRLN